MLQHNTVVMLKHNTVVMLKHNLLGETISMEGHDAALPFIRDGYRFFGSCGF
jgi:hypothetical protein